MKKFLLALSVFSGYAFSSMIGIDALGEEQVMGGTTSAAARGFAGNAKTGDAEGLSVLLSDRVLQAVRHALGSAGEVQHGPAGPVHVRGDVLQP